MKILYSPGFGAGWVTWYSGSAAGKRYVLTCPYLIERIESGGTLDDELEARFLADLARVDPGSVRSFYAGGFSQLRVANVTGRFRVDEYDGSESVVDEHSEQYEFDTGEFTP